MEIKYNIQAKNITTYGGKGVLKKLYLPETINEFVELWQGEKNIHILGGGSNTIIPDGENGLTVVSTAKLKGIEVSGNHIVAECGVRLSALLKRAREQSLGGLEFMAGVPATVGGLVRMNAGAFGHEIGVYVDKIVSLSVDNEIIEYYPPFDFGYRNGFQGVLLKVSFNLDNMPIDQSVATEKEYIKRRSLSQPKGRSTGSVFKNGKYSAGYCIDKVGLKGLRKGGAEISKIHGNFIVNVDDGSAEDFLYLVGLAKQRVFEEFGVGLEKEFILLGEK